MFNSLIFQSLIFSMGLLFTCNNETSNRVYSDTQSTKQVKNLEGLSKAYFASGCFWCVESIFEAVEGVEEVISGYAGGSADDANYSDVSAGRTEHTETVEIYYDPSVVNFQTLLVVFFDSQDPTTPNRQGPDRGRQYRSSIFYQNEDERKLSESYISELEEKKVWPNPIVVEVVPFEAFYPAEEYHQDFEVKNPNHPYIKAVSIPRFKKFQEKHPNLLKEGIHH